jgi:hypothetical protein
MSVDSSDAAAAGSTRPPASRASRIALPLTIGIVAGVGGFHYGNALFLLTPLLIGAGAAWLPAGPEPSIGRCAWAGALLNAVMCGAFLLLGLEGLICIIMAAPLVGVMGAVGGALGGLLRRRWERPPRASALLVLLILPLLLAWDRPPVDPATPIAVTTAVVVRAPAAAVWREVVAFSPIRDPPRGILAVGIAYPTHAVLRQDESGRMIRECHFTTGAFIEPITAWEPPRHLAFDVAAQPPPMREIGPWDIHPPHLDGMLRSRRGEFRLTDLGDGTTRLAGTTWYTVEIAPLPYWRLWTDAIIHRIHERVLRHIAREAERNPR